MASDEHPPADENLPPAENRGGIPEAASPPDLAPDAAMLLRRMESHLHEIRSVLDAEAHERTYREFSTGRLIGTVLQIIVAGLVVLALLDWALDAPTDALLVKLAFAAVLQLAALTAFIVSGRES
jgi:hypothetical protein